MGGPIEYTLPSGGKLLVERKGPDIQRGLGMASVGGGMPEAAEQTFHQALQHVQELAGDLLTALTSLTKAPEKVEVEFGVDLGAKAGVILTSGSIDANFKIKLTWQKA